MPRILTLTLMGGLLWTSPAAAAELEYAYPDQSVWTTRVDSRGEPDNPLLRVAAAMFSEAGITWHGRGYPASRMFEYLKNGTAHFSMLVRAPALQECCLLGKAPVATTDLRAYRQAPSPAIAGKEALAGKRVAIIRGYSYAGLKDFLFDPRNAVAVEEVARHDAAFGLLERGRVDYVLDYSGPAAEVLAAHPIAAMQSDTLSRLDVYLVLSKSYPDAEAVLARLEAIAARLDRPALMAAVPK
jgi:polar amino acid transport system substrate-binding protein